MIKIDDYNYRKHHDSKTPAQRVQGPVTILSVHTNLNLKTLHTYPLVCIFHIHIPIQMMSQLGLTRQGEGPSSAVLFNVINCICGRGLFFSLSPP